ncbi:MAG TPA: hypothetical protein VM597_04390 [Gemmataceae bacterium]|nr:hypothetical protein [Gemmataceae bacterium]
MNYALSLTLEVLEQAAWGLRVRLTVRNDSAAPLYLPPPDITGLRFGRTDTRQVADWVTTCFVTAAGGEFVLRPAESRSFEWRARPCAVEPPADGPGPDFDYWRWCVGLEPGRYLAWYQWRVDEGYFDPDTHQTLAGLERAAAGAGAEAWRGQVLSNRVQVAYGALSMPVERSVDRRGP